ncbi:MAG: nucleotidyltransferase domain-containing protein [Actinomycetes bacterium]
MPVRSSNSHVLSWPPPEAVVAAACAGGAALKASRSEVVKVGCFGSYARGDWGVGSDLDLVLILTECGEPPLRRGLGIDTISGFPAPVDLLIYTRDEWRRLEAEKAPFPQRLNAEVRWVA